MNNHKALIKIQEFGLAYSGNKAIERINLGVSKNEVMGLIGPSGCGKSTLLRGINRMNDLIPGVTTSGSILISDQDIYDKEVDPAAVRRAVGMVFQKPNPFPKSIYDNVAFGPKINGFKGDYDELVRNALERTGLLKEVKNKLNSSGLSLSGGQQQRLCIARALAVDPEIILMDEPCSALDPIATQKIEDLIRELREEYTIVIVTHNLQQAGRISDRCAFILSGDDGVGHIIEIGETQEMFTKPKEKKTEEYITGRFG